MNASVWNQGLSGCFCLGIALCLTWLVQPAAAEIPRDVRDVFESMLENLEPDLQGPFREALSKDTAVVEMTPKQFRKFRANPFNPFEGLDEIDASDDAGNIGLKFELPSLRTRPKLKFEKQHRDLAKQLSPVAESVRPSVVRLFDGKRQLAMGVVVSRDGLIVTKNSELRGVQEIVCRVADGATATASLVRSDDKNDVALLQVDRRDLTPIQWHTSPLKAGQFLLTPDETGKIVAVGNYSVAPRSTSSGEQAFLGVKPEATDEGVRISDVRPGAASANAGLRNGDVIVSLGGQQVSEVADLVFQIRQHAPGDRVAIEYLRDSVPRKTTATLAGNMIHRERAARFKMMNRLGAVPSRRNSGFPNVFQHDAPLFPEQCGGAIVDLDGRAVGLNIARNGRAATYAIPASHVMTVLEQLQREDVATRR
jgi:serine protease Do